MTEAERDVSVNMNDLLSMVRQLVRNQERNKKEFDVRIDKLEDKLTGRLDRLEHKVIGNGDEGAVIVRLRDMEHRIEQFYKRQLLNTETIEELKTTQEAWRNRVLGMVLLLPVLTAVLVVLLSHVAGVLFAP